MSYLGQRRGHDQRQRSETCSGINPIRQGLWEWLSLQSLPVSSFCKQKSTKRKHTPTCITIQVPFIYQKLCFLAIFRDEVVNKACQWHCSGAGLCHIRARVPAPILTVEEPIPCRAAPTLRETGWEGGSKGCHSPSPGWDGARGAKRLAHGMQRLASDTGQELNPHCILHRALCP